MGHGGPCVQQVVAARGEHGTSSRVVGTSDMGERPQRNHHLREGRRDESTPGAANAPKHRNVFGTDSDARPRRGHALHVRFAPPEVCLAGKLACPGLTGRWRASREGPTPRVKTPGCTSLPLMGATLPEGVPRLRPLTLAAGRENALQCDVIADGLGWTGQLR